MADPHQQQAEEQTAANQTELAEAQPVTLEFAPPADAHANLPATSAVIEESGAVTAAADGSPHADEDPNARVMTVIEHLDELRVRIIRSLAALLVAMIAALCVGKDAVRILEAPAGGIQFQALSLEEPLIVYFKVSFYLALVIACPWILWEICQFVGPGLRKQERRILAPVIFGSPLLFVAGAAFTYYCVLPPMLRFFNSFGQGMSPIHQRLDFYISLVSSIMMYMGLCFQIPIVIFCLAMAGLVNSSQLIRIWRYAIFGASLIALVITPDPTAFSMLIVMGALIGLYFLSVLLLKLFGK